MDFKDYYKILGVDRTATTKDIKSAYRALARKHHPDVNPGDAAAEGKFSEINEAFEVLGDEEERKKYDEIADYVRTTGHPPQPPRQPQENDEEASFFEQFFGRRRSRAAPRQRADLHAEVEVALREALTGSLRRLELERQVPCESCAGSGIQGQSVCRVCRGLGEVLAPESLEVRIPAGITDGSTVRIPGHADRSDLLLHIRLLPDPVFRVEGHDLHRDLEVGALTAILGGELGFDGLRGRLSLKVPPDSQNGRVFRLKGQGLPRSGERPPGDLYVKLSLRIPTGLSEAQRKLLRDLRDSIEPVSK